MIKSFLAVIAVVILSGPAPVADAAMKGDLVTVRVLIGRGADVNAAQGDGMTALHWAAERGDSAMIAVLLRAQANVRAVTRIGDYTPLHIAAKSGHPAVVRALLDAGSDARALTSTGATALHFAAAAGNAASVEALIARGSDVTARQPARGQTPRALPAA